MKNNIMYTRKEIENECGLRKDTLIRTINTLIEKNIIVKEGNAKATFYYKK